MKTTLKRGSIPMLFVFGLLAMFSCIARASPVTTPVFDEGYVLDGNTPNFTVHIIAGINVVNGQDVVQGARGTVTNGTNVWNVGGVSANPLPLGNMYSDARPHFSSDGFLFTFGDVGDEYLGNVFSPDGVGLSFITSAPDFYGVTTPKAQAFLNFSGYVEPPPQTDVPEPESYAILASAFGALIYVQRKKSHKQKA